MALCASDGADGGRSVSQKWDLKSFEGKFFVWTPKDIQEVLGSDEDEFMAACAVTPHGNFKGKNILRYVDIAHDALAQLQPMMSQYPLGFSQWLQAPAYALPKPREIAIVGDPDSADTNALLSVVRDGYPPFQVVVLGVPGRGASTVPYSMTGTLWTDSQQPMYVATSPARRRLRSQKGCPCSAWHDYLTETPMAQSRSGPACRFW